MRAVKRGAYSAETPFQRSVDHFSDAGSLRCALEDNDLLLERNVLGNELRLSRSKGHDEIQEMLKVLHLRRVPDGRI